jgi:uncharacterized delta-60 repeat protein
MSIAPRLPPFVRALCLALLTCGVPVAAAAAPGDVDVGFGDGGRALVPFHLVSALVLDSRHRIVVAGVVFEEGERPSPRLPPLVHRHAFVARYTAGGTLDPTFGDDGLVALSPATFESEAGAIGVRPDGSLLVAVATDVFTGTEHVFESAIVRLDDAGRVDPTFAEAGTATFRDGARDEMPAGALFTAPDGSFSATGLACEPDGCTLTVARYDPVGTALSEAHTSEGLTDIDTASIVRTRDGGFLLGARLFDLDRFPLVLLRYTSFGESDRRYAENGRRDTGIPVSRLYAVAVTIDGDDRPLAIVSHDTHIEVRRFTADGDVDALYTPTVIAPTGMFATEPGAIALQPDGRALVTGSTGVFTPSENWLLAMLGPDGGLDPSFGSAGVVTIPVEVGGLGALLVQPDGRILALGFARESLSLVRFAGSSRDYCDADGNTTITVTDGVQVLRAAAGLPSSCLADFCDIDASGAITVTDGVRTLRAAAALPAALACGR